MFGKYSTGAKFYIRKIPVGNYGAVSNQHHGMFFKRRDEEIGKKS